MSHMINPLATPEQLYQRRSFSALPTELQDAIFFSTQCLTQAAGLLLQLPQSVTAQANVILARYWLEEPMMSHEFSVSRSLPPTLTPQKLPQLGHPLTHLSLLPGHFSRLRLPNRQTIPIPSLPTRPRPRLQLPALSHLDFLSPTCARIR